MREQHLAARRTKKRKGTTRPAKNRWRAPDLVKRDFPAAQINKKWYGDGTEVPTDEGKLYLASVLDMASRRIPGSRSGSITTRSWPTARWPWRSPSAAGRRLGWCSTPIRAANIPPG